VLYGCRGGSYTFSVTPIRDRFCFIWLLTALLVALGPVFAQERGQKPAEPTEKAPKEKAAGPERAASKPELPFQIQLLETHIRFESNADSRKEVHTIVKINNVLGAHQFARLTFDYNRAFQRVEIPLVRISHANGGTSELLPSAVVDAPNPAVEKYPAYQDVRVKSVRILGLQEGDTIEYSVITTTTKHPLAPDFWLEHTFDRSGQVLEEHYALDLPARREVEMKVDPSTPANSTERSGEGDSARIVYRWNRNSKDQGNQPSSAGGPDLVLTTYESWLHLSNQMSKVVEPSSDSAKLVRPKSAELTKMHRSSKAKLGALYSFVSTQIRTVDLPLGATGFRTRGPDQVLESGYGTAEDKFALLAGLTRGSEWESRIALFGAEQNLSDQMPRPSLFVSSAVLTHIFTPASYVGNGVWSNCDHCGEDFWLAPAMEVAPFGALPTNLHDRQAFVVNYMFDIRPFAWFAGKLPFVSTQHVDVDATISRAGQLTAKVKYTMRGDNELVLREAFHQTAKEKWKDAAELLAISDGFRGQVTSVNVSDPTATKDPFTVEYEITQAKFVDWSKKPVRIPALLPQIGLPDPPAKPAAGEAAHPIELGTPLDVDTQMTLKLPAGTVVQPPAGTSVNRVYAKFSSKYSTAANTVTASRRVNFLLREIPGDRAMDYNAFVRAVQNDQAQMITLVPAADEGKAASSTPKQ
jgi:hypothetical protein